MRSIPASSRRASLNVCPFERNPSPSPLLRSQRLIWPHCVYTGATASGDNELHSLS